MPSAEFELPLKRWQDAFLRAEEGLRAVENAPADISAAHLAELVETAANLRLAADLMLAEVARLQAEGQRRTAIRVHRHLDR